MVFSFIQKIEILVLILITSSCSGIAENPFAEDKSVEAQEEKTAPDCTPMSSVNFENGLAYYEGSLFTGKMCSYHPNGEVHTLTSYQNGEKQGLWEIFFADGRREKSGFTRKGKQDGLYREWYPNGQLRYEYHYDLGKKTGAWKGWYEDGTRYTERHFKNDTLDGKVLVWDENGTLAKEYDYLDGRLINSQMHFKEE